MNQLKLSFTLYDNGWYSIYNSSDLFDVKDLKKLEEDICSYTNHVIKQVKEIIDGEGK